MLSSEERPLQVYAAVIDDPAAWTMEHLVRIRVTMRPAPAGLTVDRVLPMITPPRADDDGTRYFAQCEAHGFGKVHRVLIRLARDAGAPGVILLCSGPAQRDTLARWWDENGGALSVVATASS